MSPRKHQGFAGQLAHPLSLDFLLQSFQIDQIDRNWMVLQSLAGPWSHPPFYVLFGLLPHPPFGNSFRATAPSSLSLFPFWGFSTTTPLSCRATTPASFPKLPKP